MAKAFGTGGAITVKLAKLYLSSSNSVPAHFALCPQGGCAVLLAVVAALGCCGVSRLATR